MMSPDGSGLPLELWRGLDLAEASRICWRSSICRRDPGLHRLWRRMLLLGGHAAGRAPSEDHFLALRLEALYRSGLLGDMERSSMPARLPSRCIWPCARARTSVSAGARGMPGGRPLAHRRRPARPPEGRGAVAGGLLRRSRRRYAAAGLAAEPGARGRHRRRAAAGGARWRRHRHQAEAALPKRVLLLDYRFLELLGPVNATQSSTGPSPRCWPCCRAMRDRRARLQIAAAEAALRLNAMSPRRSSRRSSGGSRFPASELADPEAQRSDPLLRRRCFFRGRAVALAGAAGALAASYAR